MASLQRTYAAPAFAETGPRTTGARTRASRPTTAPVRPRAPASMLDLSRSARVPGYTGHTPGVLSDSLLGRSHAYLTGFRQELLGASDVNISENKRSQEEGTHFEPSQFTRKVDAASVAECNGLLARPEVVELPLDKRTKMQAQLLGALASKRLPAGVTELARGRWAACVHVRGRPMWGRVRESMKEAVADRKELLSTRKLGSEALEAFFRELRPAAQL